MSIVGPSLRRRGKKGASCIYVSDKNGTKWSAKIFLRSHAFVIMSSCVLSVVSLIRSMAQDTKVFERCESNRFVHNQSPTTLYFDRGVCRSQADGMERAISKDLIHSIVHLSTSSMDIGLSVRWSLNYHRAHQRPGTVRNRNFETSLPFLMTTDTHAQGTTTEVGLAAGWLCCFHDRSDAK